MSGINPGDLLAYGETFLGVPYVWGGTSYSGVDCSGLIFEIATHFGLSIPRGSRDQVKIGTQIGSIQDAQPGDLIGFDSDHDGTSEHIAMYMGNGQILVADHPGTPVRFNTLANEDRILAITRLPGVVNLNGKTPSTSSGFSLAALNSSLGFSGAAALPAARPTFDWWAGLGLKSPGLATNDETYGLIDSFISQDPELGDLYSKAVAGSWSQDQFISQLQQTQWWQKNSESARNMLTQKSTDPSGFQRQVNDKASLIGQLAVKLGAHISDNGIQNMAQTALMLNQTDEQITSTISQYLHMSQQGWYGGYAGQVELGLKAYAQDMGIPLSDSTVQNAVTKIVAGSDTLQAQRAFIQTQAEAAFPAYQKDIAQGMTVGQIAKPYAFSMSKLWEQSPNSIDLYNPTLRGALQYKDQAGAPAVRQVYDFETDLRKDPKWLKTNNAREGMLSSAASVLSNMGLVAASLGAAPATSPNQVGSISSAVQSTSTGLSGSTKFPTLQGQQALASAAGSAPTLGTSAASLAPNTSFTTKGTPQVMPQ